MMADENFGFLSHFRNEENFWTNILKEFEGENFDNVQLMDAWYGRTKKEQKSAERCFDNIHQKVREDEAEKMKLQQDIDHCEEEIERKREEKIQKRKIISLARKALKEAKTQNDGISACLQSMKESVDQTAEDERKHEQLGLSVIKMYRERLGFDFSANGEDVSIVFTHLSALDPNAVHRINLKKQRSAYKVVTCEPRITIPKTLLDNLNKKEAWKEFLIGIRSIFMSLYDQEKE